MTKAIPVTDWVRHIDREYLSTFTRDGGGAVKFAVTAGERMPGLIEELQARCAEREHLFVALDALTSRVHMPQDLFFGLASQLEWQLLARRVVLRLLSKQAYLVDGIDPNGNVNVIDAVARANGIEAQSVLIELRPALEREVTRNANMAKAFRVAMTHLCLFERERAAPGEYAGQPLLDWLTGANTRISNIKPFHIHTPINRTTARYFIESALYWVRYAGYSGTLILLDNTRVTLPRNPKDGTRYYTRAMTIEHYELLREFIDDVDRLPGTLLVALTDYTFVDEQSMRGWGIYPALRTRVMDDVRDRNIANPVAALVRLS
ncbi:MAG: DUF2791 family P-loop domain-containing protein [Gammaproteobacteria bacterium]|nr:DUF2791 family P-loop domain-containing protein [Gammaproteobacteria bacterium]